MPDFIPGLSLSELFYYEAVKPILAQNFPGLPYSAALIGSGSEVLGFDTSQSTDHNWGPRLLLFLADGDYPQYADQLNRVLGEQLPHKFRGYPTSFSDPNPADSGTRLLEETESGAVRHFVSIVTVSGYFENYLGISPYSELEVLDWLTLPEQKLRTVTAGKVFFDGLGDLTQIRRKLAYYPHEVWLLLLAAQWTRLSQEEPFMGRCGDVGDELGSQVLAVRLVRDIMKLCFLMERQYAPYHKWFGTAFSKLECAGKLTPLLQKAIQSGGWQEREKFLSQAYEIVAKMHNDLGITSPLSTQVTKFHDRPYLVLHAENFANAIKYSITSEAVKNVLTTDTKGVIGGIDQFVDSTDILSNARLCQKLKVFYQ